MRHPQWSVGTSNVEIKYRSDRAGPIGPYVTAAMLSLPYRLVWLARH